MNSHFCKSYLFTVLNTFLSFAQHPQDLEPEYDPLQMPTVLAIPQDVRRFPRTRRRAANFSCVNCNKSYTAKRSLSRHIKHECGGQKRFHCHLCVAKYTQNTTLRRHLTQRHNIFIPPKNMH
ncbi:hypothetical protein TSAR_011814 [Trichomalopsis sarcophagae]|uniref:C2H2-type domain-containing protein n=1 Tax=Trichomalopsis sarcophagae TaxID=543379 RepID=A0A232F645_9HYME|nr:hypothetical protein TSAR_011814 [Trichomalopsis sarcophagae]